MKHTWARAISMFRKRKLDREFDEELRSHIELATEDYIRRGMPPADARRLARVKFGSIEASKGAPRLARHRLARGAVLRPPSCDARPGLRARVCRHRDPDVGAGPEFECYRLPRAGY